MIISTPAHAENVTLDVYPSEQEIFEAYLRGEIDLQTYLNLNEILEDGIDSTDLYLLEEIPNISFFLESYLSDYSDLEIEQSETFILGESSDKKKNGFFRARTYQKLEESGDSKSFFTVNSVINENWKTDIRYREAFDGGKKMSRRSVVYETDEGSLSKIIFGNFTARFGLGLTVGYRGKLLSKSADSFDDSFLFPDYGGFNGIYMEGGRRSDELRLLIHYDQNSEFNLRAGVVDFLKKTGYWQVEAMVQGAVMENRMTEIKYNHYQFGAFARYDRRMFDAALEIAVPKNESSTIPTMVLETQVKSDPVDLKFSAWNYTDDFINLTGGGRAGAVYSKVAIDTIDFDFRDKRVDQSGLLLRSNTDLSISVQHEFAFSTSGTGKYSGCVDLTNTFIWAVKRDLKLRFSYWYARRDDAIEISTKNKYRAEGRFVYGDFDFKSYFEYTDDLYDHEYLSFFMRVRSDIDRFGRLDLWMNFDKINKNNGCLDYFYGYINEAIRINDIFEIGAKYSYRYSRSSSDRYESQMMLETKVKW